MNPEETKELQSKIKELKEEKNAVLLVHNYQVPEIQEMADFLGDSLELCRKAQGVEADLIVFCGVDFMAETASILNPEKKVLLPNTRARCPMAAQLPIKTLLDAKKAHPGVPVVLYVNTLAEAKAECDVVCTSANAAQIIEKLGAKEVIFSPDWNLGYYLNTRVPGVKLIPARSTLACWRVKSSPCCDMMLRCAGCGWRWRPTRPCRVFVATGCNCSKSCSTCCSTPWMPWTAIHRRALSRCGHDPRAQRSRLP